MFNIDNVYFLVVQIASTLISSMSEMQVLINHSLFFLISSFMRKNCIQ